MKSVPRQTNRSKWRQASGYTPNLLTEKIDDGKVKKGDLVFFESLDGIIYLKVQIDTLLTNSMQTIDVIALSNEDKVRTVPIDKLLTHNGLTLILPSYLYTLDCGEIVVTNVAQDIFSHILDQCQHKGQLSDEDWVILFSADVNESSPSANSSKPKKKSVKRPSERLYEDTSGKHKKVKSPTTLVNNGFYIIQLKSAKAVKHFVAQVDVSKSKNNLFWMQFMQKTDESGHFIFKPGDHGFVSKEEVVKVLTNPVDEMQSSSRSGKLTFSLDELKPYMKTLQ